MYCKGLVKSKGTTCQGVRLGLGLTTSAHLFLYVLDARQHGVNLVIDRSARLTALVLCIRSSNIMSVTRGRVGTEKETGG